MEEQTDEISVTHWLSAKSTDQRAEKRSIIVVFFERSTKEDVLSSVRRRTAENFFINETPTPIAQQYPLATESKTTASWQDIWFNHFWR